MSMAVGSRASSSPSVPEPGSLPSEVPVGFVDQLEGLVEQQGDRVVLTTEGRLLANEVAIRLE